MLLLSGLLPRRSWWTNGKTELYLVLNNPKFRAAVILLVQKNMSLLFDTLCACQKNEYLKIWRRKKRIFSASSSHNGYMFNTAGLCTHLSLPASYSTKLLMTWVVILFSIHIAYSWQSPQNMTDCSKETIFWPTA